jgi:hypothetical protein
MPKPPPPSPEKRVRDAKRIATRAIEEAAEVAADPTANRSTRTRLSYKIKAEALDRVARVLAGKPADA